MNWQRYVPEAVVEVVGAATIEALVTFATALVLAWLVKILLIRICRLTARTETELDDAIFRYLGTPVFVSLILIGAHLSLAILFIPPLWAAYVQAFLKLIAIGVWLIFFIRLTRLLIGAMGRKKPELDGAILGYLESPVVVSLVLTGAHLSMVILVIPPPWSGYIQSIFKTIAIVVWLIFLIRLSRQLLEAMGRNTRRFAFVQTQTVPPLGSLANAILIGGAAYFLLLAWDINISAWVASAGIIGLAVSLAARDSLANLFAGLAILADRPYKLGDFIVLESGERGEVSQIGLRSSRVMTRDDIEIIVPNSVMANSKIINEAGGPHPHHRVRVQVSVAYGSDIDQVRQVLMAVAAAEERILQNPEPRVRFRRFGDSGLELELLTWVPEAWMRGRVLDGLNTAVYKRFAAEGIEIPFPRRHVIVEHAGEKPAPPELEPPG